MSVKVKIVTPPTDPRLRKRLQVQLVDVLPPSLLGYHDGIPQTQVPQPVVSVLTSHHPTPHRLKGRIRLPSVVPPRRLSTLIVPIDKQVFVPSLPLLLRREMPLLPLEERQPYKKDSSTF